MYEEWLAMVEYYELLDGVAFNSNKHLACFASRASARMFKIIFPSWTVLYKVQS